MQRMWRLTNFLALGLVGAVACVSDRGLMNAPGFLKFDLSGIYETPAKYDLPQGTAEYARLELSRSEGGAYSGRILRKILHRRGERYFMVQYEAELFEPITSPNEIIFHERLLRSCQYTLREDVAKKNAAELVDADFKTPSCASAEHIKGYNERERLQEFGGLHFKVKNEAELLWYANPDLSGIPMRRRPTG